MLSLITYMGSFFKTSFEGQNQRTSGSSEEVLTCLQAAKSTAAVTVSSTRGAVAVYGLVYCVIDAVGLQSLSVYLLWFYLVKEERLKYDFKVLSSFFISR